LYKNSKANEKDFSHSVSVNDNQYTVKNNMPADSIGKLFETSGE